MHTQIKNKYKIGIFILCFVVLLFCFYLYQNNRNSENIVMREIPLVVNDIHMTAYVAQTFEQRRKGLSIFSKLTESESMIFIFEKEGLHPFWMKDMKFPIDIIWLNKNKEIIFIKEHAHPGDYPESYLPDKKSLYVIEFVDGFVEKNNIRIGDSFDWVE